LNIVGFDLGGFLRLTHGVEDAIATAWRGLIDAACGRVLKGVLLRVFVVANALEVLRKTLLVLRKWSAMQRGDSG
jgi:hypothetical protein